MSTQLKYHKCILVNGWLTQPYSRKETRNLSVWLYREFYYEIFHIIKLFILSTNLRTCSVEINDIFLPLTPFGRHQHFAGAAIEQ